MSRRQPLDEIPTSILSSPGRGSRGSHADPGGPTAFPPTGYDEVGVRPKCCDGHCCVPSGLEVHGKGSHPLVTAAQTLGKCEDGNLNPVSVPEYSAWDSPAASSSPIARPPPPTPCPLLPAPTRLSTPRSGGCPRNATMMYSPSTRPDMACWRSPCGDLRPPFP